MNSERLSLHRIEERNRRAVEYLRSKKAEKESTRLRRQVGLLTLLAVLTIFVLVYSYIA